MAMQIRRYGAERIAQYGRSRATLDATGRRHLAIICPVLPQRQAAVDAMVIDFGVKNRVVAFWKSKASVKKAQNGPSTQLIKATSCVERSQKNSPNFLAIKR